jgi:hypothetical protein
LQRRDAFAFEVSLSRSGEDRLGSKTVLNPKGILHDPSQPVVLNFCHASKITNESPNRKFIFTRLITPVRFRWGERPREQARQ